MYSRLSYPRYSISTCPRLYLPCIPSGSPGQILPWIHWWRVHHSWFHHSRVHRSWVCHSRVHRSWVHRSQVCHSRIHHSWVHRHTLPQPPCSSAQDALVIPTLLISGLLIPGHPESVVPKSVVPESIVPESVIPESVIPKSVKIPYLNPRVPLPEDALVIPSLLLIPQYPRGLTLSLISCASSVSLQMPLDVHGPGFIKVVSSPTQALAIPHGLKSQRLHIAPICVHNTSCLVILLEVFWCCISAVFLRPSFSSFNLGSLLILSVYLVFRTGGDRHYLFFFSYYCICVVLINRIWIIYYFGIWHGGNVWACMLTVRDNKPQWAHVVAMGT